MRSHAALQPNIVALRHRLEVTDAPNVLCLEDTDGDGKADIRKVLVTGFAFTNPQHTVDNLQGDRGSFSAI
ncbi:MAG: hypothetical protein DMG02_25910 [Acidobacteria bacterium]|nr:MAG: hypothetical protein DMG03_13945 [Acidobacteriota bacterium]PYQ86011.1 MAG: hypothetical protein DMG02_25910 [Acidobacteriota bacterium]PYR04516.1 MAG: hypothetical protein DMF99_31790 [Acidobacteriota bacterium]